MCYQMDYLLITEHHLFKNSYIKETRNKSDHYLILGCLHVTVQREHSCYLPLETAMETAGLEEVETYILRRQNTIYQYIANHLLLKLCLTAERRPGAWVTRRWKDTGVYIWWV